LIDFVSSEWRGVSVPVGGARQPRDGETERDELRGRSLGQELHNAAYEGGCFPKGRRADETRGRQVSWALSPMLRRRRKHNWVRLTFEIHPRPPTQLSRRKQQTLKQGPLTCPIL